MKFTIGDGILTIFPIENPLQASNKLLPKIEADGVLGIRKAIAAFNLSSEFGCSTWEKNSSSAFMVSFTR